LEGAKAQQAQAKAPPAEPSPGPIPPHSIAFGSEAHRLQVEAAVRQFVHAQQVASLIQHEPETLEPPAVEAEDDAESDNDIEEAVKQLRFKLADSEKRCAALKQQMEVVATSGIMTKVDSDCATVALQNVRAMLAAFGAPVQPGVENCSVLGQIAMGTAGLKHRVEQLLMREMCGEGEAFSLPRAREYGRVLGERCARHASGQARGAQRGDMWSSVIPNKPAGDGPVAIPTAENIDISASQDSLLPELRELLNGFACAGLPLGEEPSDPTQRAMLLSGEIMSAVAAPKVRSKFRLGSISIALACDAYVTANSSQLVDRLNAVMPSAPAYRELWERVLNKKKGGVKGKLQLQKGSGEQQSAAAAPVEGASVPVEEASGSAASVEPENA